MLMILLAIYLIGFGMALGVFALGALFFQTLDAGGCLAVLAFAMFWPLAVLAIVAQFVWESLRK